ncbi:MAG: hypothetical protein U0840_16850 [Gemmataceae bacterium]
MAFAHHGLPRLLAAGLLTLAVVALAAQAEPDPPADPIPLRRVLLAPDKLAAELAREKDGVLVRMARRDFEALVRKAAAVQGSAQAPPQLVEARYRASFGDSQALVGTAQWKVLHRGKGSALLRLTSEGNGCNLAVRQPRFDNRDALLAFFPEADGKGRSLALLVDRPGDHTVTFEWSARSEARPEGLFVDLRLPECPAASLELELPADVHLALPEGTLASGPSPAQAPDRRLWRVACGGKTQLLLILRRTGPTRPAPVLLAWQKVQQRLSPEGIESFSSFDLQSLHQDVRELVCEYDPLLRPVEVVAPGMGRWTVENTPPDHPGRLRIELTRPLRQGIVEVRSLSPLTDRLPADRQADRPLVVPWVSPGLRMLGTVPRGETIELFLHPELRLLSWQPGDFRLIDSSPVTDTQRGITQRRLLLQGGGVGLGGEGRMGTPTPRRPGGQIQAGGVEFRARQQSWWRLVGESQELVGQIDYEVRQGQLFQLAVRLPADWEAEAVELNPSEMLRSWGVRAGRGGHLLLVDLRRPLRAGTPDALGTLTVRLRRPGAFIQRDLVFPDLVPVGSQYREGGLAIDFDELAHHVSVRTALASGEPPAGAVGGKVLPDLYYTVRGESALGTLRLDPRPARFRSQVRSRVFLTGARGLVETRLEIVGESGSPESIDLHVSTPGSPGWHWVSSSPSVPHGARPLRAERLTKHEVASVLATLGSTCPLGVVGLTLARPPGSLWRIHLDRPPGAGQTVVLQATWPLPFSEGPSQLWEVPLVTVLADRLQENEVVLHPTGVVITALDRLGLNEAGLSQPVIPGKGAPAWRAFHYTGPEASLAIRTTLLPGGPLADVVVDRARLTTLLTPDGDLRHHFRFRLSHWPQRTLPVQMPNGATVLAMAVADQWIEHGVEMDEEKRLVLPVLAGSAPVLFEILYTTPAPRSVAAGWLHAPAPELPVSLLALQRRWLLPTTVAPVGDARVTPLPGWGASEELPSLVSRFMALGRLGPVIPLPGRPVDPRNGNQRAIADACQGLASEYAGATLTLGALVRELQADYLDENHPLVVDRAALQRGRLQASTRVAIHPNFEGSDRQMPWLEADLVLLPLRAGVLLTTGTQVSEWPGGEVPSIVEAAARRAIDDGNDPCGQYLGGLFWLNQEGTDQVFPSFLMVSDDRRVRQAWVPTAGTSEATLLVVRRDVVTLAGLLLGGMLLAGMILLRSCSGTLRCWMLLTILAGLGLALAWLPMALMDLAWWPLLAGLGLAILGYIRWAAQPASQPSMLTKLPTGRSSIVRSSVGTGAVLLAVALAGTQAQPPRAGVEPDNELVLLVPQGDDPVGAVLVGPRLLQRLENLARPAPLPGRGAVLVSASYDGRQVKDRAEFAVTFYAQVIGNEPVTLDLPLEEVQLTGEVLVDGARVLPVALAPPRVGFALRLSGEGRHKIELRFLTAIQRAADDEVAARIRCSIPSLAQAQVTFVAGEGARYLRVPVKFGSQRVSADGAGQKVEAELGAITTPLQIRWEQEPRVPKPARIEFREAYLWDFRVDASLLTALVRYNIRDGGTTALVLDVPPELEVRAVEARRPSDDDPPIGETRPQPDPVRLSDWTLQGTGPNRTIRLEFPFPVSGPVEVTLELVPMAPWGGNVLLPLPRPHGEPEPRSAGYLGYRHQSVEVVRTNWLRLTGIRPVEFAPFWPTGSRPGGGTLDYASSFRRDPKLAPELRVQVRPIPPRVEATQELHLNIGATRADLTARIDLAAPGKDLAVVEYEIDSPRPVTVVSVTGPDVGRWSQVGPRVLIWLEKTTASTRLELSGWVPIDPVPTRTRPGQIVVGKLDLPCLRLTSAGTVQTLLALHPQAGMTATLQGTSGLTAERNNSPSEFRFFTRQAAWSGSLLIQPGRTPQADAETVVRLEGRELMVDTTIDFQGRTEARNLQVRLRNWEGDAWLEVLAGQVTRRREEHHRTAGRRERTWLLELAQGPAPRLRLRVRIPMEGDIPQALPEIHLAGTQIRHLVKLEPGLAPDGLLGVSAVAGASRQWTATGDGWSFRVRPQHPTRLAPVEVPLAMLQASLVEARTWVYDARFWVRHEAPSELRVRCPGEIDLVGIWVDHRHLTLREIEAGHLGLPLAGPSGLREIVLRYRRNADKGRPFQPDLRLLDLVGVRPEQVLVQVDVPVGWEVLSTAGGSSLGSGPTRLAALQLHQASLAWTSCRDLVAQQRLTELPAVQRRFTQTMSLASLALQTGADETRTLGPQGIDLATWRRQLERDLHMLESRHQLEPSTALEPPASTVPTLPSRGVMHGWQQSQPGEPVVVRLVPLGRRETQRAIGLTGQWLSFLLICGILALSPPLRLIVRWLWPEQLLLAALVIWYTVGLTLPVLVLITLALTARTLILLRVVRQAMRRSTPRTLYPSLPG